MLAKTRVIREFSPGHAVSLNLDMTGDAVLISLAALDSHSPDFSCTESGNGSYGGLAIGIGLLGLSS